MPAEWEPQEAVWLSWPLNPETWPGEIGLIQDHFARLAAQIARFSEVRILCVEKHQVTEREKIIRACTRLDEAESDRVTWYDLPTNDVWIRDHGPVWVLDADGLRLMDFTYNAWGGKFPLWDDDHAVPSRLAEALNLPREEVDLVVEGGGIESNGAGTLLTTEPVFLNPNRWPKDLDDREGVRRRYEDFFRKHLGVKQITWLPHGLAHDDTDGHIDNLARFVAKEVILAVSAREKDENHRPLRENREVLQDLDVEIIDLPLPDDPVLPVGRAREERLCASYANFLIGNGFVIVPTFAQPRSDDRACGILRELFPKRDVIGLDARDVLREGGAWHCCSNNQPAAISPSPPA